MSMFCVKSPLPPEKVAGNAAMPLSLSDGSPKEARDFPPMVCPVCARILRLNSLANADYAIPKNKLRASRNEHFLTVLSVFFLVCVPPSYWMVRA